jgi:hypothetical protein
MAKAKVKKPETITPNTDGFYNEEFLYAPNAVFFPDGTSIVKENKLTYTYPVNGWTWFDSIEDAYAAQGKTPPVIEDKKKKRPQVPQV